MPRMDYSAAISSVSGGRITERYEQFKKACDRVRVGEWGPDEFLAWLEEIWATLKDKAADYVSHIEDSGYYNDQTDEVENCFTGIEQYETGMETMRQYVDTGDVGYLDQGLQIIWEGNEYINEAMRMNREFRRNLEEEWGYMT